MRVLECEDIQSLLDSHGGTGMVVSCYANTSVVEGFSPHWRQHLKDEARRVRATLAGDADGLDEFERQLRLIHAALESGGERGARGMAVFTKAGFETPVAVASDAPFEDRLVVNEEPYLVPFLLDQLLRPEYLVVLTDTHRGRIYAARPGSARLLAELEADVPQKNKSAGERWGKQQATIARHREDCILHYFIHLADRVEATWTGEGIDRGIILLGEHEILEEFRAHLPKRLASRVVAELPHAWAGERRTIEAQVSDVVSTIVEDEGRRLLDEIEGRLREGCGVISGPQEVIDALASGQARAVVFGPDLGEVGWRCRSCRSLFTTEETACPYCKAPCERANLWQEVLSRALNHKVRVHFVPNQADRRVPGQIAALLVHDQIP